MRDTLKGSHTGFRLFLITCWNKYTFHMRQSDTNSCCCKRKEETMMNWPQFCAQAVRFHHHWFGIFPKMGLTCWRDPAEETKYKNPVTTDPQAPLESNIHFFSSGKTFLALFVQDVSLKSRPNRTQMRRNQIHRTSQLKIYPWGLNLIWFTNNESDDVCKYLPWGCDESTQAELQPHGTETSVFGFFKMYIVLLWWLVWKETEIYTRGCWL